MNNCITELLQIKDKNIILDPTFKKEKIKGQTHFIFKGVLTYKPTKCECCNSKKVVKNGFNEPTTINLLKLSGIPSRLTLKKQRFKCKQCNKKFVARTSLVLKHCHISQNVKLSILKALTATLSFKQISKEHNVSENTTIRILKSCRKQVEVNCYKSLPQHLCFDEIKSTKDSKHSMSFVFLDAKTHDFIDIVEGRTKYILNSYFLRFKRKTKNKVKTICIDIYPPYMDIIKKHFPNARIIIDRFHIIQNINRELNKERVRLMNIYRGKKGKEGRNYTILKNFWRLVLADEDKIDYEKYFYNRSFGKLVTRRDVLNYILSLDKSFRASYEITQEVRKAVKDRDEVSLKELMDMDTTNLPRGIAKAIKTMKRYREYMINSVKYEYSNGPLEGFNNKIKLVKRVSYGYNSFDNFRLRILIMSRLFVSKYKNNERVGNHSKNAKQLHAA